MFTFVLFLHRRARLGVCAPKITSCQQWRLAGKFVPDSEVERVASWERRGTNLSRSRTL